MSRNLLLITFPRFNQVFKRYAGHSKWANIKHLKSQKDAERAALFTRLSRQIKVAIQEGGTADPNGNIKLEQVIEQAKRLNMPVASIQNVLKSTQLNKNQAKIHLLEIKGPGGCLILCEVYTDNIHYLRQTIATPLKRHSSKFTDGGARHSFEEKGIILVENNDKDFDKAMESAIEAGAEDVRLIEDEIEFICAPVAFVTVQNNLIKMNYKITSASLEHLPVRTQVLNEDELKTCSSLYEKLENIPEVVKLYDNIA